MIFSLTLQSVRLFSSRFSIILKSPPSFLFFFSFSAICNQSCGHGICATPYICSCQAGWTGPYCDIRKFGCIHRSKNNSSISFSLAVCVPSCVNGNCTGPNYCSYVIKIYLFFKIISNLIRDFSCNSSYTGYLCLTRMFFRFLSMKMIESFVSLVF